MNYWTIKKLICTGFAGLVAASALVALVAAASLGGIGRTIGTVAKRAIPASLIASQLERYNRANFAATQRHLLSQTPEQKTRLERDMKEASEKMTALYQQLEPLLASHEARAAFARVQEARPAYTDTRKLVLAASNRGDAATAFKLLNDQLYPSYEKYVNCLVELIRQSSDEAESTSNQAKEEARSSQILLISSSAFSVLAGAVLGFLIVQRLSRTLGPLSEVLHEGASQVASAATQIASASQSLADGASRQAAALEETAASLHEMSSMTGETAKSAEGARVLANETRAAADAGARNMQQLTEAMRNIQAASDNIAKILGTIDEIAFQTNILALNAAVEAARAGSAGAGFAVVADEVRRLAQHSAQAAHETAQKIEESLRASDNGARLSGEVARNLTEIVQKARQVDDLIGGMATASQQQSRGIEQINAAVGEIDQVTQSTAAAAEESASAAEELCAQAAALQESVNGLSRLVHGRDRIASTVPNRPAARPNPRPVKSEPPRVLFSSN